MINENIKLDSFANDGESAAKESGTVLLPCPFCGCDALVSETDYGIYIGCKDEECIADYMNTLLLCSKQEAIAAWNTRAAHPDCFDCSFGAVPLTKLTEEDKERIRPFVERTCHNTATEPIIEDTAYFICSNCGNGCSIHTFGYDQDVELLRRLAPDCPNPEEVVLHWDSWGHPSYCPSCGARVVGDD